MNAEPPVAHFANRESSAAARLSQTFVDSPVGFTTETISNGHIAWSLIAFSQLAGNGACATAMETLLGHR